MTKASGITSHRGGGDLRAHRKMHVSILPLMHMLGQIVQQADEVERLPGQHNVPGVQLPDVAHLGDERHEPFAGSLGLLHESPLAGRQRLLSVARQQSEVATDDADRRPEFVDGQRKELRITFFHARGWHGLPL
jgi:hypothetical protein